MPRDELGKSKRSVNEWDARGDEEDSEWGASFGDGDDKVRSARNMRETEGIERACEGEASLRIL